MKLTKRTRALVAAGALVAVLVYLVIVDVGLFAGQVHRGVHVHGIPVGGLTQAEAQRRLEGYGAQLRRSPIVFTIQGYDCRLTPREVGWRPSPAITARRAMDVGRTGGLLRAARDRFRSWFGGVNVGWGGGPNPERVADFISECIRRGQMFGVRVDEERLEEEMDRILNTWPRDQLQELPLEGATREASYIYGLGLGLG